MLSKIMKSRFVSGGIWYTLGNILIKGIIFLTLPIFTRILTPEEYGEYNTYIAYQSIVSVIIGFGLSGCIKNAKIDFEKSYEKLVSSVISLELIALSIILIVMNSIGFLFDGALPMKPVLMNILLLTSAASSIFDIMSAKWVIELEYKKYIIMAFFNTVINVFLSIFLIKYVLSANKYMGRIIGESVPLIAIAAILAGYILWKNKTVFNWQYWSYALKIGIPLVPHMLSKIMLVQFDRIMLNKLRNSAETGIYGCMYNISSILNVLLNSFDMVWIAWLYPKMLHKDYMVIKKNTKYYIILFSLVCICFSLVMPEVLMLFVAGEYRSGINAAFVLVFVVYINFLYLFFVNIEFYFKDTMFSSIGTVMAAVVNIILNAVLIPEYGYMGAAFATAISYMLLAFVHYIIFKLRYRLDLVPIFCVVAGFILTALSMAGIYRLISYTLVRYMILLLIAASVFIVIIKKKGSKE